MAQYAILLSMFQNHNIALTYIKIMVFNCNSTAIEVDSIRYKVYTLYHDTFSSYVKEPFILILYIIIPYTITRTEYREYLSTEF